MRSVNLLGPGFEHDDDDPPGYRGGRLRASEELGAVELAVKSYELATGESISPYHYEYAEEWAIVLEGTVAVRTPEGEAPASRGEAIYFAPGADGAHKITNRGDEPAIVVMFSSAREPAVAVYPDSDKIGVWPGDRRDQVMLRREDGDRGYWDREP